MQPILCVALAAWALTGPGANPSASSAALKTTIHSCKVSLIEEAEIAAQEAGVIETIEVTEGQMVERGDLLANINDDQAQIDKKVAEKEAEVTREQAKSEIEVNLGYKSQLLTKTAYEQVKDADLKVPGAKSKAEIRMKLYDWEKAILQTEKAIFDRKLAELTADAKDAKVQAAQVAIDRRRIEAPISGKVVKLFMHPGEWANPGDPVLRVVRLDRLRIEGYVNPREFGPADLHGRAVEFKTEIAGGRTETFQGRISFVNFEVEPGGQELIVWAEVVNRDANGEWLLQPGLKGDMTIDLDPAHKPVQTTREPVGKASRKVQ